MDTLLQKYGFDWLNQFSNSCQDFYNKNILIIRNNERNASFVSSRSNTNDFYNPVEFNENDILFVDDQNKFNEMLHFFENEKIDIIGN